MRRIDDVKKMLFQVSKKVITRQFHKRGFDDNFTTEEMEDIKQLHEFLKSICFRRKEEDIFCSGSTASICLVVKASIKYNNQTVSVFIDKYISENELLYFKIDYFVAKAIYRLAKRNCFELFYCVNLMKPTRYNGIYLLERMNSNALCNNAIFIDVDLPDEHKNKTEEELLNLLSDCNKELFQSFSYIIHSGGGLHCYLCFKKSFYFYDTEDELKWKSIMNRYTCLLEELGADFRIINKSRILRVPFSYNRKYGKDGKQVKIIKNSGLVYEDIYELEQKLQLLEKDELIKIQKNIIDEVMNVYLYAMEEFQELGYDSTMFYPVEFNEPIFSEDFIPVMKNIKLTDNDKPTESKKTNLTKTVTLSKDIPNQSVINRKTKERNYIGITCDYETIKDVFYQNRDMKFLLLNRDCTIGIRNYLVFLFIYNWYKFGKIKNEEVLYEYTCDLNNNYFKPSLHQTELDLYFKEALKKVKAQEKVFKKGIKNSVVEKIFHISDEEKLFLLGNYSLTEEENKERLKRMYRASYKKKMEKNINYTSRDEKVDKYKKIIEDNPTITFEEFNKLTNYSYKKELGLGTGKEKTKHKPEEYLKVFEDNPNITFVEYKKIIKCDMRTYKKYLNMYLSKQ